MSMFALRVICCRRCLYKTATGEGKTAQSKLRRFIYQATQTITTSTFKDKKWGKNGMKCVFKESSLLHTRHPSKCKSKYMCIYSLDSTRQWKVDLYYKCLKEWVSTVVGILSLVSGLTHVNVYFW